MLNHSLRVVRAITVCALTLVLASCNVASTSAMSTAGHSLVTSTCTPEPVGGAWMKIYSFCANRTDLYYQNVSKFSVLDVVPANGSAAQIGPASGGEQPLSSAIGQWVVASLVHPALGTQFFPGQNIHVTQKRSTDMVEIKPDPLGTTGFYAARTLADAVLNSVDDRGLHELSTAVQSCAHDVATTFNNLNQLNNPDRQGGQAAFADAVVQGLDTIRSCRDLVAKVQEKLQERRANKDINKDEARNDLADSIHQDEPKMKTEYQVIEGPPVIEGPLVIEGPPMIERTRDAIKKIRPRRIW